MGGFQRRCGLKIVCISDTHTRHTPVPDGDILIHAGDATFRGTEKEIFDFSGWYSSLPHHYKIFVAGNHDIMFETNNIKARSLLHPSIIYLQDSGVILNGIKFWGSPWQPEFFDWAFNLPRGEPLKHKWSLIPDDTNVLITHGPPYSILDRTPSGELVGCKELVGAIKRVEPAFHVFGHIHNGYGIEEHSHTTFINASICDEDYLPVNKPIVIEMPD